MQVDHEFILAANYMDIKTLLAANYMDIKVILAANYMDIKAILDVGCKAVANMIKGKPPEEIRKTFNIQNDFTPEEEDQIRRENELVGRRLEERNLLIKKTAGAGVETPLTTRRRSVTSSKKQPGSRDVPVVSFDVRTSQ